MAWSDDDKKVIKEAVERKVEKGKEYALEVGEPGSVIIINISDND